MDAAHAAAQRQIESAKEVAQLQIETAQTVARQQVESAQAVARLQLVMPMREAWIGQLRRRIANYLAACFQIRGQHYDLEMLRVLGLGRDEIELMLDPNEEKHRQLNEALTSLLLEAGSNEASTHLIRLVEERVRAVAKVVLQSEWQRAKAGG